jgi:phage repressor protein C with HTH and peptisase S24 domain
VKISGERFAAVWRETAMSQETFAAALGMKRSGVFRLMRPGIHGMFTDNFRQLAGLLRTSPQELLARIGEGENRSFAAEPSRHVHSAFSAGVRGPVEPVREISSFHGISAGGRDERLDVVQGTVKVPRDLGDFCVRVNGQSMLPEYPHESVALFEQVEGNQFTFGKDYLIWFTNGECYFSRVYESDEDRDVLVLRKLNEDRERFPDRRIHRREIERVARSIGVLIRKK